MVLSSTINIYLEVSMMFLDTSFLINDAIQLKQYNKLCSRGI